jgi:hypothetical protein
VTIAHSVQHHLAWFGFRTALVLVAAVSFTAALLLLGWRRGR